METLAFFLACSIVAGYAHRLESRAVAGSKLYNDEQQALNVGDAIQNVLSLSGSQLNRTEMSRQKALPSPPTVLAMLILLLNPANGWQTLYSRGLVSNYAHHAATLEGYRHSVAPLQLRLSELPSDVQAAAGVDLNTIAGMLHTPAQAAVDQEERLRKGDKPDTLAEVSSVEPNRVYLVGVGPGDTGLLTVKAQELMQIADLILYDRLISPEILQLVGPNAQMLYVGKNAALAEDANRIQEKINQLLLAFATTGKTVVRLKGGDPTIFGRGGEEMEFLERQGMKVEIVPGITSASGIAASLGVPLTHRDHASSVRFVTGHGRAECKNPLEKLPPMEHLADESTTLVVYMGLQTLPDLTAGLINAGLPMDTPAVAVQDGTTQTQRVVKAEVGKLAQAVEAAQLRSPTLVLIGQVVSLLDDRYAASAADKLGAAAGSLKPNKDGTITWFTCGSS